MESTEIMVEINDLPSSDTGAANTARISFARSANEFTDEENSRLVKYLSNNNHWTPIGGIWKTLVLEIPSASLLSVLTESINAGILATVLEFKKTATGVETTTSRVSISLWKLKELMEHTSSECLSLAETFAGSFENCEAVISTINPKYKGFVLPYKAKYDPNYEVESGLSLEESRIGLIKDKHTFLSVKCRAPIFIVRQLMKHQVNMVWNEESRRYISTDPSFFVFEEFRAAPEKSIKQGSAGVLENVDALSVSAEYSSEALKTYRDLLSKNVAPEEARACLTLNSMTNWIWTGNVDAFKRVLHQRLSPKAQTQVREFAAKLEKAVEPFLP